MAKSSEPMMKMRKKPGPKPMAPEERKSARPSFYINVDLMMEAHRAAALQGISTGEWFRRAITEKLERDG